MRIVDSILMEMDQEAQTTKRLLERIPDDKMGWKPHPKSHSLGQLAIAYRVLAGRHRRDRGAKKRVEAPKLCAGGSQRAAKRSWMLSRRAWPEPRKV